MKIDYSKFNLILHIGAGKTGTTSIQQTLKTHKLQLDEQKVSYLGLMLEHGIFLYPWQKPDGWVHCFRLGIEKAQQQIHEALIKSINQLISDGYHTAIWSNESFFSDHSTILSLLWDLHNLGINISVIIYVRRHDSWARSAYLQWGIKHKNYEGKVKSFQEWYQNNPVQFSDKIQPWLEQQWIKLFVRNFDLCGDIIVDFLQCCNLKATKFSSLRENETPSAVALALWALYNSQVEEPVLPSELGGLLRHSKIFDNNTIDCDYNSLIPTHEDLKFVQNNSLKDRQILNDIFQRFGQPKVDETILKEKDFTVTNNQIFAALIQLLKFQQSRINQLDSRIKKIENIISNLADRTE